ncbi:hypothetical protein DFH06DRAFT_730782 [Mycena polygramma]|nr:hypothetical protein DFH06DRAFT_730782 [Mycena polygramma]
MSARQPFVPGSGFGPPSRAAQANGEMPAPLHFVADPSNPLNGGPVGGSAQKDLIENAENRPLNIGSLTKSNRTQNLPARRQSIQTPVRPATSDLKSMPAPHPIMRPGTSDPHSKPKSNAIPNHRLQTHHPNSHGIVAPTPLQPRSAPSLFSNSSSFSSAFKTPALPGSSSTDSRGFRAPANDHMSKEQQQQQDPDQTEEDIIPEKSLSRLKTLPSQPGPHRIVFGARAVSDAGEDDEIYEIPESEVVRNGGNGRNKRGRSEVEDDDEHAHMQGYGGQAKRFKGPQTDEDPYHRLSNDGNEMYSRSSSPHDVQEYPPQQPRRHTASRASNHPAADAHRFPPQYPTSAQASENPARTSDADRLMHLLKADGLDLAVDTRVEKYTRLVEKWKGCTRDEWIAGADELTQKYAKIFDFVKSHMVEKVRLFAECDEKLEQHGGVLKGRDTLLANVRARLLADSGAVLSK